MNYLGQGAGEKRSAKLSCIVHSVLKTAKEFRYHGVLICSLNQNINKCSINKKKSAGVCEKESLYVKKDLFFQTEILTGLHEECKQYFISFGNHQFMHNRNVCSRRAFMETVCVSLGWNYAFYVGMGEFAFKWRTKHFIDGTGCTAAKHSCQFLFIIALLTWSICSSFWSF